MKPKEFRDIRERLGLTQKELAEVFGLSSHMTISHYESGFRNPSPLLRALLRVLDTWSKRKRNELIEDLRNQFVKDAAKEKIR